MSIRSLGWFATSVAIMAMSSWAHAEALSVQSLAKISNDLSDGKSLSVEIGSPNANVKLDSKTALSLDLQLDSDKNVAGILINGIAFSVSELTSTYGATLRYVGKDLLSLSSPDFLIAEGGTLVIKHWKTVAAATSPKVVTAKLKKIGDQWSLMNENTPIDDLHLSIGFSVFGLFPGIDAVQLKSSPQN